MVKTKDSRKGKVKECENVPSFVEISVSLNETAEIYMNPKNLLLWCRV